MNNNQLSKPATGNSKWTKPAIAAGVVVIIAILPLLLTSPYTLHIFILTFIYTIAAVSLRTIITSGQFPLAHGAFMGVGAYGAAMIAKWLGWSPWLTIPLGGLIAMGIGMLIGYPFARLRALYYAMGSLFFGMAIIYVIWAGGSWTGGYSGLTGIPPLFPIGTSKVPYYYFFLGLAVVSFLALYRFEFSRIGINLKAIAQSHLVASSVGINEALYRVLVMYVLIGGVNSFIGPIIGTFILVLIPEFARDLKIYVPFISAGILLIVVYIMPQGLVSLPQLIRSKFFERGKSEKVTNAP